jgi:hypothetical protein
VLRRHGVAPDIETGDSKHNSGKMSGTDIIAKRFQLRERALPGHSPVARMLAGAAGSNHGPATTDIKDAQLRGRLDRDASRGPAVVEIDSPHLRGERCLIAEHGLQ